VMHRSCACPQGSEARLFPRFCLAALDISRQLSEAAPPGSVRRGARHQREVGDGAESGQSLPQTAGAWSPGFDA
jgi:hypothetical protein